jgi:hypothetical protein
MTSSHQRSLHASSVTRSSAQPTSSVLCFKPPSTQLHRPHGWPTVRSIVPGWLVMSSQVVSGGRV